MIVPHGDRDYAPARAAIAIRPPRAGDEGAAVDLDGFFGLHPALAPLVPFWQSRALAVVHACGSPDKTRSHFDAQDYMESGTPGVKSTADGWLARAAMTVPAPRSPFRAVALGPTLPRALRGDPGPISLAPLDRFDVRATAQAAGARKGFEPPYHPGGHALQ